jgi:hypothetical protein
MQRIIEFENKIIDLEKLSMIFETKWLNSDYTFKIIIDGIYELFYGYENEVYCNKARNNLKDKWINYHCNKNFSYQVICD